MDAQTIAAKARNRIGTYCINECHSYCCRKGFLPVKAHQVSTVCQGKEEELKAQGRLNKNPDGSFSLVLAGGCPSLKDNMCTIHKNPLRPEVCGEFPIRLMGKTAIFASRCAAVADNKFYEDMHKLEKLGYKIEETSFQSDPELYRFNLQKE